METVLEWIEHPAFAAGLRIAGVLVGAVILTHLLRRAVRRIEGKVSENTTPIRALQRTRTLAKVLSSAGIVAIWAIAGIYMVSGLGFNLAPLLAGVGIIGLAIGFGAQDLVRDVVTGFFILLEDQYGIGDVVQINEVATGTVEQLTLRLTGLRDLDGTVHFISNGSITHVANRTKDWSRAVIDVRVAYTEEPARIRDVLKRVAAEVKQDKEIGHTMYDVPEILGVETLGDNEVVWRMIAETKPGRQWNVGRQIRERVKKTFSDEGIEIPQLNQVMVTADSSGGSEQ
jgi:small-conductance mechanosensitive channel